MGSNNNYALIALPHGLYALVDAEDFERVASFPWHIYKNAAGNLYARNTKMATGMHRFIMGDPKGLEVDHRNNYGLDNRKENLRVCTVAQNRQNRCISHARGLKGIHQHSNGDWRAQIRANGRTVHLGLFKNQIDAARAYDEAALKYFGEFAALNFPKVGVP